MTHKENKLRSLKAQWIKELESHGEYDKSLEFITEILLSGKTLQSINFLEAVYAEITKDTKIRANRSFYAAIFSMLVGFAFLFWAICDSSLIATIGSAISGFITMTFLKIHKISLKQLNRFYRPEMKEIFSLIEHNINNLPDSDSKENVRISLIEVLLGLIQKNNLNSST